MMNAFTVSQLLSEGAAHANLDVEVVGWVVDRFEHRAIYDTGAGKLGRGPGQSQGIWLSGALPECRTVRGKGPLHGLRAKLSGKFHWQPRSGAGHMGLWPAWLGVKSYEVLDPIAEPDATPNGGPAKPSGNSGLMEGPPSVS